MYLPLLVSVSVLSLCNLDAAVPASSSCLKNVIPQPQSLIEAVRHNPDAVGTLLSHNCSVHELGSNNKNALIAAVQVDGPRTEVMQQLLDAGCPVNHLCKQERYDPERGCSCTRDCTALDIVRQRIADKAGSLDELRERECLLVKYGALSYKQLSSVLLEVSEAIREHRHDKFWDLYRTHHLSLYTEWANEAVWEMAVDACRHNQDIKRDFNNVRGFAHQLIQLAGPEAIRRRGHWGLYGDIHPETFNFLLKCGADPRKRHGILHCVCRDGSLEKLRLLLAYGSINIEARYDIPYEGSTPLFAAVLEGHVALVQELVQAGADVNARCGREETSILEGCSTAEMARILVESGRLDVNSRNSKGKTAFDKHGKYPHLDSEKELCVYLKEQGALTGEHFESAPVTGSSEFRELIERIFKEETEYGYLSIRRQDILEIVCSRLEFSSTAYTKGQIREAVRHAIQEGKDFEQRVKNIADKVLPFDEPSTLKYNLAYWTASDLYVAACMDHCDDHVIQEALFERRELQHIDHRSMSGVLEQVAAQNDQGDPLFRRFLAYGLRQVHDSLCYRGDMEGKLTRPVLHIWVQSCVADYHELYQGVVKAVGSLGIADEEEREALIERCGFMCDFAVVFMLIAQEQKLGDESSINYRRFTPEVEEKVRRQFDDNKLADKFIAFFTLPMKSEENRYKSAAELIDIHVRDIHQTHQTCKEAVEAEVYSHFMEGSAEAAAVAHSAKSRVFAELREYPDSWKRRWWCDDEARRIASPILKSWWEEQVVPLSQISAVVTAMLQGKTFNGDSIVGQHHGDIEYHKEFLKKFMATWCHEDLTRACIENTLRDTYKRYCVVKDTIQAEVFKHMPRDDYDARRQLGRRVLDIVRESEVSIITSIEFLLTGYVREPNMKIQQRIAQLVQQELAAYQVEQEEKLAPSKAATAVVEDILASLKRHIFPPRQIKRVQFAEDVHTEAEASAPPLTARRRERRGALIGSDYESEVMPQETVFEHIDDDSDEEIDNQCYEEAQLALAIELSLQESNVRTESSAAEKRPKIVNDFDTQIRAGASLDSEDDEQLRLALLISAYEYEESQQGTASSSKDV